MTDNNFGRDLRLAYRLIYAYQKSAINLADDIRGRLGHRFYWWEPVFSELPPQPNQNPVTRSAWDMLPMYASTFYSHTPGKIKLGSYGLIVFFVTDSDFERIAEEAKKGEEPDFRRLKPGDETETNVKFLYAVAEEVTGRCSWEDVFTESEWFDDESFTSRTSGAKLRGGSVVFKLSDFADEAATTRSLQHFRSEAQLPE